MHGDLAAGERSAERAFQIGQEAGQPDAVFVYGAALPSGAQLSRPRKRGDRDAGTERERLPGVAAWQAAVAAALLLADRAGEAEKLLERGAGERFERHRAHSAALTALALYAEIAVLTDRSGPASILYELIEPWTDQVVWNGVVGYGHDAHVAGPARRVMGEHEQADSIWRLRASSTRHNGLSLWAARGHLGWAEALAGRGEGPSTRPRGPRARALAQARLRAFRAARGGAPRGAVDYLGLAAPFQGQIFMETVGIEPTSAIASEWLLRA